MSQNRRFFLKALGSLGLASAIQPTITYATTIQTQDFNFVAKPYLQNFNQQEVSILAIFNKPCIAWVEIYLEDNSLKEQIYQTEDGMRNANAQLFKFKISHNNKDFKYKVFAKEVTKFEPYKIEYGKTIQSEFIDSKLPFIKDNIAHLLILNDIHENTASYTTLYNKSSLPRKDLVFLNGDTFHHVNNETDVTKKLIQPITEVFATKSPFVMVRGNHETRGSFARDFKKYFDYPQNKFYQSMQIGPVFIIVLDAGEDKPDEHTVYGGTVNYDAYRLEQKHWLEKRLQSKERKKAKHCIIINHIPWFHSDDWHGTLHNRACFHELTQKHKVDAVLSGHTHEYGFFPPNADHNYHVIIGGGPKEGNRTFIEVSAENSKLLVSLKKDDGTLINSFTKR